MGKFTFRKGEKLKSEKNIQELFAKGSSFYLFPFKVLTLPSGDPIKFHQVLISVSKRHFKRAVDRNLIKRRIREAYRLQKQSLAAVEQPLLIGFIYTHKEILQAEEIAKKTLQALQKIPKLHA